MKRYSWNDLPRALLAGSLVAALGACGTSSSSDGGSKADMAGGPADMACNAAQYPCGPYGRTQGQVIENLALPVQSDTNMNGVIDAMDTVRTAHFSDYFQSQGVKALFVGVAAGWCEPCKMEQPDLVALYNSYGGKAGKVAFLEAIIEKPDRSPADTGFVDAWAGNYKIPFDMASDPNAILAPYYNTATFPMQMVISTKDMKITWQQNGPTQADRKAAIDAVLNAK